MGLRMNQGSRTMAHCQITTAGMFFILWFGSFLFTLWRVELLSISFKRHSDENNHKIRVVESEMLKLQSKMQSNLEKPPAMVQSLLSIYSGDKSRKTKEQEAKANGTGEGRVGQRPLKAPSARMLKACGLQNQSHLVSILSYGRWDAGGQSEGEFDQQVQRSIERVSEDRLEFYQVVHDPSEDQVVSYGILNGLYGPSGSYPSVTEMHTLCEAVPPVAFGRKTYIDCSAGKVAVEVGSALGMVSLYWAKRGMLVHAFDPVLPNIQKLKDSVCLNGFHKCIEEQATRVKGDARWVDKDCARSAKWGSFSHDRLRVHHRMVEDVNDVPMPIHTEFKNLAATIGPFRGGYHANVTAVTLDKIVTEKDIEVLLLTSQGHELPAVKGALHHLRNKKVRNVVFSRYWLKDDPQGHTDKANEIVKLLIEVGYLFYNIEACGRVNKISYSPPEFLNNIEILDYINDAFRQEGDHPTVLAQLPL